MNIFKFFLTLTITIVMLLLMDPRSFYGLPFHEWAGLIIGLFFILHKLLNWGWIKKVTVSFYRKYPGRTRFNYILDVLLLAGIFLSLLGMNAQNVKSGYKIAQKIQLPGEGFRDYLNADDATGMLYVSHGKMVHVVDMSTGKSVATITDVNGVQ